uniref:Enoyl-CoA hydratase 2, peroxisomal isoform X3 n=2 Tax=Nicotiana TaxID=4085 RepID=A0A1S3YZS7_TOBAC|nr:PREDICTED: enoyl-CoA hydratase 2, peroxisomal-like isoform X2 [Nicotiana sylvestris]XP_016457699.1 PREDICTED: enoyl-CoA hydratase 2, peroxisomal-like isoform X3 [Nicotiana tabacum]
MAGAGSSEFNPESVISYKFPETLYTYTERDAAIYALGIGACGNDAVDNKELKYVYNADGQEFIQILNKASVAGLHDKGKAAVIEIEIVSYEKESGEPLCMNRMSIYLRGSGGFSKPSRPYSYSRNPSNQTAFPKIPKSQPFAVVEECTQASLALLYRLSGDDNPLHSDPLVASIAGFSRPILHGLCTLGFAIRAIIGRICRGDHTLIKSISGRFLLHVYPGETLITEMWPEASRVIYQVKVKERNRAVLLGFVDLDRINSSL